jgi:hypothetical protein
MPIFVGEFVFRVLNNYIMKKILKIFALLCSSIMATAQNQFDNDLDYAYAIDGEIYEFAEDGKLVDCRPMK